MAKQESGLKVISVLVIIAMFSAILLAYVNQVTKEPIAENKRQETQKAIQIVLSGLKNIAVKAAMDTVVDSSPVRYFQAVGQGAKTMGYAIAVKGPNGFTNDFDMMVGVDSTGSIIDTYVLDHKETPGLGDAMQKEPFKKQFRGRSNSDTQWKVSKDGGDIDAITAATITSRAFTAGVRRALDTFEMLEGDKE